MMSEEDHQKFMKKMELRRKEM